MEGNAKERFSLKLVSQKAENILQKNGFTYLPIDPFKLAEIKEIQVQAQNGPDPGFSGALVKSGDIFGIMYSTHLRNPGFERFSVAHELGHYFLDGHPNALFHAANTHLSKAGFVSDDKLEREADTFAASLLMPEALFKDKMNDFELGLSAIKKLADVCQTSLTATAIRYTDLIDKPVAVIISTGCKVDYCLFSKSMWRLYQEKPPKRGQKVPMCSPTFRLGNIPNYVTDGRELSDEIDIDVWSESNISRMVIEEAIGLGRYGKVLTVISLDT